MEQQKYTYKAVLVVGAALLLLTVLTVEVAGVDLGKLNFLTAILIASAKAALVALFFMNLRNDRRENSVVFGTSFLFLGIFIVLTATDVFTRGDVYVKGPLTMAVAHAEAPAAGDGKEPWVSTSEAVAKGKMLFGAQCAACHGAAGKGDGPAATALKPPPRDFSKTDGWKNGRKPSQVMKTMNEGLPSSSMPSFKTMPIEDRWALVHFVLSLGPTPPADTTEDLAKIGIKPGQETVIEAAPQTIPLNVAIAKIEVPEPTELRVFHRGAEGTQRMEADGAPGARIYRSQCMECHGLKGEGAYKVSALGVAPKAFVTTQPFTAKTDGLRSPEMFAKVVTRGMPGDVMPGSGQITSSELRDLYQYVKSLAGR